MIVQRARILGFCPGVRRAVQMATDAAGKGPGVFLLGQLVHNPHVSSRLEELGAVPLSETDIESLPPASRVVIRSHGIPLEALEKLRKKGTLPIDATCPKVAANQKAAATLSAAGISVVIAGDPGHGETRGVASYAPGSVVLDTPKAARAYAEQAAGTAGTARRHALIAQTTFSRAEYDAILAELRRALPEVLDRGGICGATAERQEALAELCGSVDAIVVVGGSNSANSRRLAELARNLGKPAWLVESPADIPDELAAYGRIGLSAGASTPDEDIDAVERALMDLGERGGR